MIHAAKILKKPPRGGVFVHCWKCRLPATPRGKIVGLKKGDDPRRACRDAYLGRRDALRREVDVLAASKKVPVAEWVEFTPPT